MFLVKIGNKAISGDMEALEFEKERHEIDIQNSQG